METIMERQDYRPRVRLEGVRYPDRTALERYVTSGVLPEHTLAGALRESFERNAQRKALLSPEGDVTYRRLDELTDRFGAALLKLGVRPLDRVVMQCGNCNELMIAFLGCLKAGLIPICALQAFRRHEISYLANLAEASVHIVQGDDPRFDDVSFAEEMQSVVPTFSIVVQARGEQRGVGRTLASLIEGVSWEDARETLGQIVHDPYQAAVFQLSGGTTGVPKIIPRFQNEYLLNMQLVREWNRYTQDDVLFMPTPLMHNMNMACFFGPMLLAGGAVIVCPNIAESTLQQAIRDYKPTWFGLAGPIYSRVADELAAASPDVKRKRRLIGPKNAPGLTRVLGSPCYHIFGMTEGVIMFAREGDPQYVLDESVGRPVCEWDEVKVVLPGTEEELPDGEVGEALFRGPYTIRGYYKSEEKDVHRFTADGFYRSGDLMKAELIDGKRYFFFRGRTKDVVDRGGEKINAEELENLINRHPDILASAVVGMPDPVYGERVCAFVVMREPGGSIALPTLTAFLEQEGVAKFKWPERIEIVSEFPVTASGKLSKVLLRNGLLERLQGEKSASNVSNG
jgi:non-ribosomal peptide synthetase component E (peptide arylation enzyme)